MSEALVLGGGGVGGIAWITGVLAGLADAGQDVTGADLLLGTSAGSTVSAQLGSGLGLAELYARQVDPALQSAEIMAVMDLEGFAAEIGAATSATASVPELRRAVGRAALAAPTVPEPRRRAVIESRLPSHGWPERALRIVAVDAESGEPRVFDKDSGVPLVDAVAASCAVPGVWPPVSIDGRRYVDGGVRSMANLDYVDDTGADRVMVIVPMGMTEPFPSERPVERSVRELRARGAEVVVVAPDEAARAAIGDNPLDPGTRGPAAEAGRAQGRALRLPWRHG
ncbi:patatin-like phospholipase family protein [Streptomyces sp. ATE26]|uniref:patatin-like phospholipase family protein n=1 Tax=unclassified Streptomyces TaxID=2593676 RepID=UPI00117544CD|nr:MULTISPECIES: patatin-like phospholipase family protein [unclassified Streptomyces]MDI1457268.1 patatin-like phospholipase family protein [Streptomyces sp. ATE26]GEJ99837.1 patatin [Streptomyces sp. 1-11]